MPSAPQPVRVLEGKAIVVTGAGRGLGRAYARHAVTHGARVVVNDIDGSSARDVVEALRRTKSAEVVADEHSVADWEQARALVDRCVQRFGQIDGLVNNAGLFRINDPQDETPAQLAELVGVNLVGTVNCTVHALRHMQLTGSGAIVNVTSGAQSGMSRMATYAATKAGVAALTASWANDLRSHGIRVNAVSPTAETRMVHYARSMGRPAASLTWRPDNVAPLVTYLLSDLADTVTGRVIRLDGSELSLVNGPRPTDPVRSEAWGIAELHASLSDILGDGATAS